jgi:hypothetical protein
MRLVNFAEINFPTEINDVVVDVVPEANPSKEKLDYLIRKNNIRPSAYLTLVN